MTKMTKEQLQASQTALKVRRINDLALGRPVAELDHLTLKHATHVPFSIGLTVGRKLSNRTIDCSGKITPIYRIFNHNIVKGYRIYSEVEEEMIIDGEASINKGLIVKETFRPIIFAISHIGKFDIETVAEFLPHFFLLSGDYENLHGTSSGSLLEMHGIIYFDMDDNVDRKNVKEVSKQVLSSGNNMLWCIEGTHNFSPNQLLQNCPYGIVEVAEKSGAVILPIGVQQFNDINFFVKIGKLIDPIEIRSNFYLNNEKMKKEGIEIIRSGIATEVYSIITSQGVTKRKDISEQTHEDYIANRLNEWAFTREDVERKKFVPPYIIPDEETHLVKKSEFHPPYAKPFITFNEETFNHMQKIKRLPYDSLEKEIYYF